MPWTCWTDCSFPSGLSPFCINEFHLIELNATTDKYSFWTWASYSQEGIFSVTLSKMISIKPLVQLEFNLLHQLPLSCYLTFKKSNFPQEFIIPFTFLFFPSLNKFNKLLGKKGPGKSYSSQDDKEEDSLFRLHLLQLTLTLFCPLVGADVSCWYNDDAMMLCCCYAT